MTEAEILEFNIKLYQEWKEAETRRNLASQEHTLKVEKKAWYEALVKYYIDEFGWDEEADGEMNDESIAEVVLDFIDEIADVGQPIVRNYLEVRRKLGEAADWMKAWWGRIK